MGTPPPGRVGEQLPPGATDLEGNVSSGDGELCKDCMTCLFPNLGAVGVAHSTCNYHSTGQVSAGEPKEHNCMNAPPNAAGTSPNVCPACHLVADNSNHHNIDSCNTKPRENSNRECSRGVSGAVIEPKEHNSMNAPNWTAPETPPPQNKDKHDLNSQWGHWGPNRATSKSKKRGPYYLDEHSDGIKWITKFANRFLREGAASSLATLQEIIPGYKKSDPTLTENYRFFALSCTLSKIIRRAIANRLYNHIKEFFPESYFGFIKGVGTQDSHHVLRRIIEKFLWSTDVNLIITSLDFYKAYDRVFIEVMECMLDSWRVEGHFRKLVSSFLQSTCRVVGTRGFPDSATFRQKRGLPTGAPEAPIIFIALMIWWDHGKPHWLKRQAPDPDVLRFREMESQLLPTTDITYADDRNLFNLSEKTAQQDVDYTAVVGPLLGLILNTIKCVVRVIVADSAYTRGTAKRTELHRILPPPLLFL